MDKDTVLKMFPKALELSPYNDDLYRNIRAVLGDDNGELKKLAEYFGVKYI